MRGSDFLVEQILVARILIRGPFVENQNWTVLQERHEQRQTAAFTRRQRRRSVGSLGRRQHPLLKLQSNGKSLGLLSHLFRPQIGNAFEQTEIGKYHGKLAAEPANALLPDDGVIERDASTGRLIQAGQKLRKRRLAAAVTARDENDLAGAKCHVERPERKYVR